MEDDLNYSLIKKICNEQETPLYLYDLTVIRDRIKMLKKCFPEYINLYYSMKANPNISLLSYIKNFVSGIEICSEGELFASLHCSINPQNIIFVGPGKTFKELEYAIEQDVFCIVAESVRELEQIQRIASAKKKKTPVAIRINPKDELIGARIKMGGASKQFGIDEENVNTILANLNQYPNIYFKGIHVYMGTQITDAKVLIQGFRNIFDIAKRIQNEYGVKLNFIDFGGGFGIPYFPSDKELDLNVLNEGIHCVFEERKNDFDYSQMSLIIESGRFLVAECGYFLTRVLYKKCSRGKTFLVVDGGSNHHSSAAGMGRFVRNNFPISIVKMGIQTETRLEKVDIVGPLCTPTDVLAQNIELPVAEEGDIIIIHRSGAYGLSASMINFLSHPRPAELVIINQDSYKVKRERGNKEEFI